MEVWDCLSHNEKLYKSEWICYIILIISGLYLDGRLRWEIPHDPRADGTDREIREMQEEQIFLNL